MGYREKYDEWLTSTYFDADTKAELKEIESNEKEIEDRFYKDLEFGTAGLRGVIGAGTNRMNIYTVRKATQGLANYIAKKEAKAQGVAIAYDSRRMSPEFADEAALCLAANGIKAYVFESLRPTPELSFAVRKLGCMFPESILQRATIRRNTTDTRYTGRMAHRSPRLMTKESWLRLRQLRIIIRLRLWGLRKQRKPDSMK